MQQFILHWGEMGSRWGVNRSVAQIHALLFLAEEPLSAEEIADTLSVARSNVSNSLKELQNWELVTITHVLGDRRDHFEAKKDIWEVLTVVLDGRKRREIDPAINILEQCSKNLDDGTPSEVGQRIHSMLEFLNEANQWYEQTRHIPRATLLKLMRMGAKISKVVA
ncbi:MAG: MarR family transcriptional regulator [Pseudomonadota bacterium]